MAHNNRDRQKKNAKKNKNHDVLGVVLIAFSLFFLLCICIPPLLSVVSWGVFNVVLGVFGIVAYPVLIALLMLGVFLLLRKTPAISLKTGVCIALLVVFSLFILQLATTHAFLKSGYSKYIEQTYSAKYSAGGVIMGALAYGLKSLITEVGCYIVFSVAIIVTVVVMLDVVEKIRAARASVTPVEKVHKPAIDFEGEGEAQRVVPVGPQNRLFVGNVSPKAPAVSSESGKASDIPHGGKRSVTDYTSSPIIEYYDNTPGKRDGASAAAQVLYGAADEINELERKEFESKETPSVDSQPAKPPVKHTREYVAPPEHISEPFERVSEDAQVNANRPKKIEHESSNGLDSHMQIFFPVSKNIDFNPSNDIISDDALAAGLKEDAKKLTRSDMEKSESEKPFVMPKFDTEESIFSDDTFEAFDITSAARSREPEPIVYTEPPVAPQPEEREDIIDGDEMNKMFTSSFNEEDVAPPPTDDDIITDAPVSAPLPFSSSSAVGGASMRGGDDIIDAGYEDKQTSTPLFDMGDDGIIDDNTLTISDGPALDLSETHDITSDLIDGDDRSGRYVSADQAETPAPKKTRSRSGPIDNQISIESEMMRQANESIAINDTVRRKRYNYSAPPIDLLKTYPKAELSKEELEYNANRLAEVIGGFLKTTVNVINIIPGPTVTQYEIEVPTGIPVKNIESRASDIEYELATVSHIRIEAPIPGKRAIGIEIPNVNRSIVGLREVIESNEFVSAKSALTFAVGKDIAGSVVLCDLIRVPHLLIAGQTGSGKSACLNGLLTSLLYKSSPDDLRFILVDPKRVEFSAYRGMPHLLFDRIIYEPNEVLNALKWGCMEMERRYALMSKYGRNNIASYNELDEVKSGKLDRISQIVIVIDELADIMQSAVKRDIEDKIKVIAAKARAAGIHLIVATQRPSSDVITGTIKTNLTSRIAFRVASQIDSRIILDNTGAEALVGNGDMLFFPVEYPAAKRVQGSYISDTEVISVINYIKEHYECDFDESAADFVFSSDRGGAGGIGGDVSKEDELFPSVLEFVIKNGVASTSGVQRRFSIGYSRAARIIDIMGELNYIGPATNNSKPREVFITREKYKELYGRDIED